LTRTTFATHIVCDSCGAVDQLPPPSSGGSQLSPDGWLPPGIRVIDMFQTPFIGDLCPKCMRLPLAELIEHYLEQARQAP
jgi:hypothetical protein